MKNKHSVLTASALLTMLVACGDNSSSVEETDIRPQASQPPVSRIAFNPGAGVLPIPNDLLFSGTTDGTLELPDEVAAKAAGTPVDLSNPAVVLGALDGWSTQMPLRISVNLAANSTVDASSLNGSSVVLIEARMGGDAGCEQVPRGAACGVNSVLSYGSDYVAVSSGADITIVPLKPLKPASTYLVALTNAIADSRGEAVSASEFYENIARDDVTSTDPTLGPLQAVINSYEAVIAAVLSTSQDNITFSAAWTTSSVGQTLPSTLAVAQQTGVNIYNVTSTGVNVEQVFIMQGLLPPEAAGTTSLALANLHGGQINLPYYLDKPTPTNPSAAATNQWTALCDSPVTIAAADPGSLIPANQGPNHATCQAISPLLSDYGLDTERYLTRYNPVPAMRSIETVNVQITTPALAPAPWPIVIIQHGITSKKEDMLAITGALSAAGFATFAIDHPLHGERGFDINGDGNDDFSASAVSATHYLNLSNLLVARDNVNQSTADLLALRLALASNISGSLNSSDFDLANVQFVGMSLGGITGVNFVTTANTNNPPLTVSRASFVVTGGGIAAFLTESANFGPLVQASVLAGAGTPLSTAFTDSLATPDANCLAFVNTEQYVPCMFNVFVAQQDSGSLAEIQGLVASFAVASQTVLDSADPNNFAETLASTNTSIYMPEIVGNGADNLPDQVIPNQTVNVPIGGTEPLARYLNLQPVDSGTLGATSGLVRFTDGNHSSLLSPQASLAVTTEMQTQLATFHAAGIINITDASLVAPVPD